MNINPSDGGNLGWGNWPVSLSSSSHAGSRDSTLTRDFVDGSVWHMGANFIAIVRHDGITCSAARVWRLASSGLSMSTIFKPDSSYQRALITTGGVLHDTQNTIFSNDPFFGAGDDIAANWWYSNNGARLVMDKPQSSGGTALSCASCNDDDVHGLGNEFGAGTNSGGRAVNVGSGSWWHDVSVIQPDCHGGSCTIQGTDHGTSLNTGTKLGNYAIYMHADAPHDGTPPMFTCGAL